MLSAMNDVRATLTWLVPYAASVVLTKGVALITIPLLTRHLTPADYGALELVSSVIEIAALILSFSAADLLFRFTGTSNATEAKQNAAAIAGGALMLSILVGGALQLVVLLARPHIEDVIDVDMLSIGILCASFSALIELPLAWLRSRGSARTFLIYVSARALLQTAMMTLTLTQGYGAFGVIAGNAAVDAIFSLVLLLRQYKETGISVDTKLFVRAARYGWPLLGGAIAMFILGNCDRWFLAGTVTKEELAHYALAAKLATIVALSMQPFGLWWNARRMRILMEPSGYQTSATAITWGFACLSIGAIWVAIGVPPLIRIALPEAYHPAIEWLPWLIVIVAMNETSSLLNVSAYLGKTARPALVINASGAAVALAGYILLAPTWGVCGAIAATIAGHSIRLLAYVSHGMRHAPIPYNWTKMLIIALIALYVTQNTLSHEQLLLQAIFVLFSSISIVAIALQSSRGSAISPKPEPA